MEVIFLEEKKPKKLLFTLLAAVIPVAGVVLGVLIVLFTPLNRLLSRIKHRKSALKDNDEQEQE